MKNHKINFTRYLNAYKLIFLDEKKSHLFIAYNYCFYYML